LFLSIITDLTTPNTISRCKYFQTSVLRNYHTAEDEKRSSRSRRNMMLIRMMVVMVMIYDYGDSMRSVKC
jgi:hypothetical protein